jgi:WD40 repeat protein
MKPDYLLISYHEADAKTVDRLSQLLAERGLEVHSMAKSELATWQQARAMAVCLGPYGLSQRQKQELGWALARQGKAEVTEESYDFPLIPVLLPGADLAPAFLFRHAWVDLRHNLNPGALDKLAVMARQGTVPLRPIATLVDWCPYRGLQSFREEDAAFFFGREKLTARLLNEITPKKLVVLVGPTGSGKTSVVQAGLLPLLRRHSPIQNPKSAEGTQSEIQNLKSKIPNPKWEIVSFTPGDHPFHRLVAALHELSNVDDRLGNQLANGDVRLVQVIESVLAQLPEMTRLLVVIDQFEELFFQTPTPDRRLFVEALLSVLSHPQLALLITLQAEFYGEAMSLSPEFSRHLEQNIVHLEPLTRGELESAMLKPARPVTLAFEPGLVERVLDDLAQQPRPLPLLGYALLELWRHHQGGLLRHSVYEQIGGVSGAIAYRAEQVFQRLTSGQQVLARRMLTRLIQVTPEGGLIKRPVRLKDFSSTLHLAEMAQARTVVQALAEAHLLTLKYDKMTNEEMVEVANETLVYHWPRWQNWLAEEREFLLWRRRLDIPLAEWERAEVTEKALLQGAALVEAEGWLERRRDNLDSEGRVYIWHSLARRDREYDRRGVAAIGVAVALILGIILILAQQNGVFVTLSNERNAALEAQLQAEADRRTARDVQMKAEAARWKAEHQYQITLARFLAAQAQMVLDDRLDQGMLLAIESMQRLPSVEGERVLHRGLTLLPHPIATIQQGTEINALIFSPDGQWLITAGKSALPRVWQTATGQANAPLGDDPGFPISAGIQLSANSTQVVAEAATDRTAVIAFSPNGQWLATGSWQGVVQVWAVATGQLAAHWTQEDAVTALAFSPTRPDGTGSQWLAVGSWDGSVRIWPLALDWMTERNGERVIPPHPILRGEGEVRLKAHKDVVLAMTFSPDGRRLATVSADNTAGIWDVAGIFERFRPLPPFYIVDEKTLELARLSHESAIWSVAFSPDGHWLATGSSDRTVRLWDVSADADAIQEVARLPHPDDVKSVAFSPNGLWLVSVSTDNVARVWLTPPIAAPVGAARQPVTQMAHGGKIYTAAFSPNSRWLATTSADHTARLWEVATGQEVAQMAHDEAVLAVAFSPTSLDEAGHQWVATASRDGITRVWEIATGQEVTQLEQPDWILGLHFSPNGQRLATRSREIVRIWTMETGQLVTEMTHPGWIHTADFSPAGRWLATGSRDQMARVWEVGTGAEVAALAHPGPVQIVAFSPAGRQLATASNDYIVRLWDIAAIIHHGTAFGRPILELVHQGWVHALAYSPDGRWLATASADKAARIWDAETGQEVARLTHDEAVLDVAFSPAPLDDASSRWLATASADHTVRLWSVSTGRQVGQLILEGRVEEVLFSPDGRHLATKSENIVQVWEVAKMLNTVLTSEEELVRLSHPESVRAMAFSPDGQWLATATGNPPGTGSVYLWKTTTGEKVAGGTNEYWVTSVAFSQDGRWLVTGGGDRLARIWLLQPEDLIAEACARLTRNLTRQEWQQYLGDEPYRSTCPNLPPGE